jgi:AcrR family transcriptional regulator
MSSEAPVTDPAPARPDRRAARRQETMDEIVAAAWEIVRDQGLAGLSMRDLGRRVSMKAQSIYSYFGSKHEIYDAMFHQGYTEFAAAIADSLDGPDDPADTGDGHRTSAHRAAHRFFAFCTSDTVRYQLLFQRTIPDFVPSAESYAVAVEVYESMTAPLAAFGITDPEAVDLWTAVLTGLTDQQISNDPGGQRWERIIDPAVDMLLRELAPSSTEPTPRGAS